MCVRLHVRVRVCTQCMCRDRVEKSVKKVNQLKYAILNEFNNQKQWHGVMYGERPALVNKHACF